MTARTGWLAGTATLAFALGTAAGVAAERLLVRRVLREDHDADTSFGTLRGEAVTVTADDGTPLHVEIDSPVGAPDDGLTLVFSHGFTLRQGAWHFQRRDLRNLGRLVTWDQRSHGRSGRGPDGSHRIDQLGRDLAAVLATTCPEGPIVLVGHSMGGMTVMALAAHHPELFGTRVHGVALLGTSSGAMSEVPFGLPAPVARAMHRLAPSAAMSLTRRAELIERARGTTSDLAALLTHAYSFGGPVSPELNNYVADMIAGTPIDVVVDFLPTFEDHDKVAALGALAHVETLVMVGDRDLLTPSEHSDEIVRQVPGAEYVLLPATGHMIAMERYDDVNRELRALVARVRRNLAARRVPR